MPKKEKSPFIKFFKEDAEAVKDILGKKVVESTTEEKAFHAEMSYPQMRLVDLAPDEEMKSEWRKIRSFFRTGHDDHRSIQGMRPVSFAPIYNQDLLIEDFPVWVAESKYLQSPNCSSFKNLLEEALEKMQEDDHQTPILSRQLGRILQIAQTQLNETQPDNFVEVLDKILDAFENQIDTSETDEKSFQENLILLKRNLPIDGSLIPYSSKTVFQLLMAAIDETLVPNRSKWMHACKEVLGKLNAIVRIEEEKGSGSKDPAGLQEALSFVDSMMKFDTLSSLLPDSGAEQIEESRLQRIKLVISKLESADALINHKAKIFIDNQFIYREPNEWENIFPNARISFYDHKNGFDSLQAQFNEDIVSITELYVAKRIGELEAENNYHRDVHDDYFNHFNWENFSHEEMNAYGHYILIADEESLFEDEFKTMSTVFSQNIPVKILALKSEKKIDSHQNDEQKENISLHAHTELSALMLSFKNIFVAQSTTLTPTFLYQQFVDGLTAFAPAFFHLMNINVDPYQDSLFRISSSIEGRDFPGFTYKGLLGSQWGTRFHVDNNPAPNEPWPEHRLTIINQEKEEMEMSFPFTYAHHAAINPENVRYYMPVSPPFWSEDLVTLPAYLTFNTEERVGKVPFIWMVNQDNELEKIAISWPIVIATQERLDFWRFLQENSGIQNYHAGTATEQTKMELEEQHALAIAQVKQSHAVEIARIKEEEAGQVMENLTNALLNLDTSNIDASSINIAQQKKSAVQQLPSQESIDVESKTDEPPTRDEEPVSSFSSEPYIDTALCTTCNECTQKNSAMFKYNADKMAYIADPHAGTFKDLVEAAELCPVEIIHPGTPLNPDEPNLDELIKRAEKFN